jgi:hypothetical protein
MLVVLPGEIAGEATPGGGLACRVTDDLPHLSGALGRRRYDGGGTNAGSLGEGREQHDEDDSTRGVVIRQAQRCW